MSDIFGDDGKKKWALDEPGDIECPLCERKFSRLGFKLHLAFDKKQIQQIKTDHPEWQEDNGACFACINLYRSTFSLPILTRDDVAPFLRMSQ